MVLHISRKVYLDGENITKIVVHPVASTLLLEATHTLIFKKRAKQPHFQQLIKQAADLLKKRFNNIIRDSSSNILASYGGLYFSSLFQRAVTFQDSITDT